MSNLKSKSCVALTLLLFAINITVSVESAESREIYANSSSSIVKSRMKRYLIFQPGSRILVRKAFQWAALHDSIHLPFTQFRINVKDNIIRVNQIFAHAFGFRANIDLLQPVRLEPHKIRRREVYETLEELINQLVHVSIQSELYYGSSWRYWSIFIFSLRHGFDGRACILKTFCDASKEVTPQSGMLFKLFKLIFT